ncbi:MAG TPA: acyl-CoA dehydrogenase family protein [Acidimicrobiales bacterium]|nr:acyl-CoA dehydrogenase family protein [Acidimicrobiales bacterium]
MDFDLPGESDPRRLEVRRWLEEHPSPSGRQLAEAGLVAPHWPRPWGLDADPVHQLVIDDELRRAKVSRPGNPIGIGWAGPTIIHAGTEEQKSRYLTPLLAGEEIWCQLFSEPEAGSDLADLATRAVRDGDTYVVNGQKIWTSLGHYAKFGILIARTGPDAPKHRGISYFICPMDTPGITVTPIVDMTGAHAFNQVFFDDVRLPAANLVGEENNGWALAKVTLGNERVSLSGEGALWGRGPTAGDLIDVVRGAGGSADPLMRQRLAALFIESEILRLIRLRTVTAAVQGRPPGPEASVRKALADEHGKHIMGLAKDLTGAHGLLMGTGPCGTDGGEWSYGYLFSPALTIGGGTSEVQRNIIGERVLGLPHDIDVDAGRTWSESRRGTVPA